MSIEAERAAQAHPPTTTGCATPPGLTPRRAPSYCGVLGWHGHLRAPARRVYAPKVAGATVVCIAQKWDENTVQLRFAGARSEWVRI